MSANQTPESLVASFMEKRLEEDRDLHRTLAADAVDAQIESITAQLEQLQREQFERLAPRRVEVRAPRKRKAVDVGMQHEQFDKLVRLLGLGLNAYIVGPAGSGKTHACFAAAKALGREAVAESFCVQSSKAEITGYMDAQGRAVLSKFRNAVEQGWLYVADEIDSASANIITVMNAVLAASPGTVVPFPDQMVTIHKDFLFVATANTYGRGASREYVGRNPLDAASLDRFVMLEWGYDHALEDEMARAKGVKASWVKHVRDVRAACEELKIRQVVSPRATINGGLMLEWGEFTMAEVEDMVLFKGLDEKAVEKIRNALPKQGQGAEPTVGSDFMDFLKERSGEIEFDSDRVKFKLGGVAYHKREEKWGVVYSIDSDGDPHCIWVNSDNSVTYDSGYYSDSSNLWEAVGNWDYIRANSAELERVFTEHCNAWKESRGK